MATNTSTYRWVGNYPQDLSNGRMMGPGDFVDLTDEAIANSHNKLLIDEGRLIPIESPKKGDNK